MQIKKIFMLQLIMLLPLLCIYCIALASGSTTAIFDKNQASVVVPKKGLGHVHIRDTRIQSVRGKSNCLRSQFDRSAGDWFFQILPACAAQPFSVFLKTENGQHLELRLIPTEGAPSNIVLVQNGNRLKAAHWEKSGPFEERIISLVRAMWHNKAPEGFRLIMPEGMQKKPVGTFGYLYEKFRMEGEKLVGTIYLLKNRKNHPIQIKEYFFRGRRVRAVALADTKIPAHGSTTVLIIEGRH